MMAHELDNKGLRHACAQIYINWLDQQDLLEPFSMHDSLESVFYSKKISKEAFPIINFIFQFLMEFDIFEIIGGMYSLKRPLEHIKRVWNDKTPLPPKNPFQIFLKQGLNYLDEIMMGGTAAWDPISQNILFEAVFTQPLFIEIYPDTLNIIEIYKRFKSPKIGIYGMYPQVMLDYIETYFTKFSSVHIFVPNERIKKQIISYCEIDEKYHKYSSKVIELEKSFERVVDVLIIPNGLFKGKDLTKILKSIDRIMTEKGILFLKPFDLKSITGLEPLFMLHPNYNAIKQYNELGMKLKSMGYTNPTSFNNNSKFQITYKNG